MASLSDFLGGDTLANAGNILGQGMARRGGLLGLPLGALIGGASQNALQQRQQGIQNTLANQIRSYAAQSKDPSEQAQLHMAADMAAAGGDPSSLLHIAKTAANKPTFFKSLSKAGELQGAWSPETGQFVPYNGPAGYTAVPKEQNPTSPFTANYQSYLLTHPGDEAGAAQFAQQKDLATAMQLKQAGERPEYDHLQIGDKIYTYEKHDPSNMRVLGNAPPSAANSDSFTPVTLGGSGDTPGQVYNYSHKHGGVVGAPLGNAPPKKGATATRGNTTWKGYKYETLKNPDGSMIATLSDTDRLGALLAPSGLGKKAPKTLYFKRGSTKPIELPDGLPPEAVESAP